MRKWTPEKIELLKRQSEQSRSGQPVEPGNSIGEGKGEYFITTGKPGMSKRKNVATTTIAGPNGPLEVRVGRRKNHKR